MSLRARLVIAFAYVMLLVLVALEVPLGINLSKRVNSEVEAEASGQAQIVAATATDVLTNRKALDRLVRRSAEELEGRVVVVDRQGRLLADSVGDGLRSTSYASRLEVAAALDGRAQQGTRRSESLDQDLLYTAVPILQGGRPVGAVRVTQSIDQVQSEIRKDIAALVALGLVALLLGAGVGWLLAGSLTRPLRGLAAAARRVTGGDLEARAPEQGSREQREVAEAFNEMTAQLARTLAAQREFVANASHQLRTPLTGLRLRIEAAAVESEDAEVRRQLDAAEQEAERLGKVLSDLLELSRQAERPARGEPVSLLEAANLAGERWAANAAENGKRLFVEPSRDVEVYCSAGDLAIMLDNLVENAIKYSPADTAVSIELGSRQGYGSIAVLDRGPGLDEQERARVFDRFYRSGSEGARPSGTGLGLSIVSTLVKRWGGTARIVNRAEGGARAELSIPLAEPRVADSAVATERETDRV